MAPWVHLHVWPNGEAYACCLHPPENGALGNVVTDGLRGVWNGNSIREMRINMLSNKATNSVCSRCYQKETEGFSSLRTWMNDFFIDKHAEVVNSTLDDGTVDKFNLVHWDFRFSNICNLKCRTCGPVLSSGWYEDSVQLRHGNKTANKKIIRIVERNDPDFWGSLESIIPELETIHFAGGEPLMMEEHYKVLELLHKHKKYDVSLQYSTNLSFLQYKNINLIEQWAPFRSVTLAVSLDGYGEKFNLIRKNAIWDEVENNLRIVTNSGLTNIQVRIHCTVSVLNIWHLADYHRYLIENKLINTTANEHWITSFMINPVISPAMYSFTAIPAEFKQFVIDKLTNHITFLHTCQIDPSGIHTVIDSLQSTQFNNYDLAQLVSHTILLDKIRNEETLTVFPELTPVFAPYLEKNEDKLF